MKQNFESNYDKLETFIKRCKTMKKGEFLECHFGRDSYKVERGFILSRKEIYAYKAYLPLGTFKSITDLQKLLQLYPEIYAANVHSGELLFWTNWIQFLEAFKLKK